MFSFKRISQEDLDKLCEYLKGKGILAGNSMGELFVESRQNLTNRIKLTDSLNCLYTDMQMLMDGSWVPDGDSAEASADQVNRIAQILVEEGILPDGYEPMDTREVQL